MKDRMEEFIREHRTEFDLFDPNPQIWKGVEKEISRRRILAWRFFLSRASILLIIFGASFVVQQLWFKSSVTTIKQKFSKNIEIPELKEAEIYYTGVINDKLREVEPLLTKYPQLNQELHTDLSQLDSVYIGLKNDLKDNIDNQEVLEALIQNYRLRISILEDMLSFTKSRNTNDTTKKYRI